jgi:hypothetical protein
MGIIIKGITIYIVIAELKLAEMFNPSILAQNAVTKRARKYCKNSPFISRIELAIIRKSRTWITDIQISITTLDVR